MKTEATDKMKATDQTIYDVCNDYSLQEITTIFRPSEYRTQPHRLGVLYIHKKYNEIHYLKGIPGLEGQYI